MYASIFDGQVSVFVHRLLSKNGSKQEQKQRARPQCLFEAADFSQSERGKELTKTTSQENAALNVGQDPSGEARSSYQLNEFREVCLFIF